METITNPTNARKHLFKLINETNRDSKPVIINGTDESKSAILISKKDYDAQQETIALMMNGQLQDALARINDKDSDFEDIDDVLKEIENE